VSQCMSMTWHAQQRAIERGIDIDTIMAVAEMGKEISRDETSRTVRFKKHCIVINPESSEIVTVYRMESHKRRAKKRRQYKRKMQLIGKHERKM